MLRRILIVVFSITVFVAGTSAYGQVTDRIAIQEAPMALGQLGYDAGFADGTMSNKTRQALQQYQEIWDFRSLVKSTTERPSSCCVPSLSTRS